MEKYEIYLGTDAASVPSVATVMASVLAHASGICRFHVLHYGDVSREQARALAGVANLAGARCVCELVDQSVFDRVPFPARGPWPLLRLLAPFRDDGASHVLWLDNDTLVRSDIGLLFSRAAHHDTMVAAALDGALHVRDYDRRVRIGERRHFNPGVVVFNRGKFLREYPSLSRHIADFDAHRDWMTYPDEDLLLLAVGDSVHNVGVSWNCMEVSRCFAPDIVHFIGPQQKPWLPKWESREELMRSPPLVARFIGEWRLRNSEAQALMALAGGAASPPITNYELRITNEGGVGAKVAVDADGAGDVASRGLAAGDAGAGTARGVKREPATNH
jgi:lipopolysaccharide biosynthesis glycosyltransferase